MTPSLSPDATQVITGERRGLGDELWLHRSDSVARWIETERGDWPAWSPDGARIAYTLTTQPRALVVRSVNGSDPRTIATGRGISQLTWTPTSDAFVYAGEGGVWLAPIAGGQPRRILENGREPAVSPDGRHPRWTNEDELFFACGAPAGDGPGALRALCVAKIDASRGARRGSSVQLFDASTRDLMLITYGHRGYDVTRDGSRILLQRGGVVGTPIITLVENVEGWLAAGAR
jgi:Tol biopolymer transport system component